MADSALGADGPVGGAPADILVAERLSRFELTAGTERSLFDALDVASDFAGLRINGLDHTDVAADWTGMRERGVHHHELPKNSRDRNPIRRRMNRVTNQKTKPASTIDVAWIKHAAA